MRKKNETSDLKKRIAEKEEARLEQQVEQMNAKSKEDKEKERKERRKAYQREWWAKKHGKAVDPINGKPEPTESPRVVFDDSVAEDARLHNDDPQKWQELHGAKETENLASDTAARLLSEKIRQEVRLEVYRIFGEIARGM